MIEYVTGHPKEAGAFLVIVSGLVLLLVGLLASTDRAVRYQLGVKIEIDQMAAGKKRVFELVGALLLVVGFLMLFFLVDWVSAPANVPATAAAAVSTGMETPPSPSPELTKSATASTATAAAPTPVPTLTVSLGVEVNLQAGETVAQRLVVAGTYGPDISDDIWLLVRPTNGLYYPQSVDPDNGEPALKVAGRWEVSAVLGEADDTGQPFEVVVVTANAEASAFFSDTMVAWCRAQNYPGLAELPIGATVTNRVRVIRGPDSTAAPMNVSNATLGGSVTINSLADGESVPESVVVGGTVSPDMSGAVWVLVYPYDAGRWYPQSIDACAGIHTKQESGNWQVTAWFGSGEETRYVLVAVLADAEADTRLAVLQKQWCEADSYPGLRTIELPQGIEEKARVLVRGGGG